MHESYDSPIYLFESFFQSVRKGKVGFMSFMHLIGNCLIFLYCFFKPYNWKVPVSLVLVLPVYIWRKSWYSFVSETCIFVDEYMFIVEKNDTNSSNSPMHRPPEFAIMSPNLSHVQCGRNIALVSFPFVLTFSSTFSIMSARNWWKVLLHRPL